jgi:nitrate reductase gamma subunit
METAVTPQRERRIGLLALATVGSALVAAGLAGWLTAAWGYGLFTAAVLFLSAAGGCFGILGLTRLGDTALLERALTFLLGGGIASYALALCAFAGFFVSETLHGRMELRWIVFGPIVLASLIILDKGLYQKLIRNNLPTWFRYRKYISRERSDPEAMRRTLVDDVIVQRSLLGVSRFRWLRHTLIFWGFMAMVLVELFAVFLREGFPAFGWRDVWREPGHPLRLAFDAAFDVTGLMVLLGCVLAIAWRIRVNALPERKFSDTPTTIFLLFVIVSGFVVEGLRVELSPGDPWHVASFVGVGFGWMLRPLGMVRGSLYEPLWLVHVIAACGFIAYVPVKRLIHTCATPMGRLMNSQKGLLAAKKRGVLGAMLLGRGTVATSLAESSVVEPSRH